MVGDLHLLYVYFWLKEWFQRLFLILFQESLHSSDCLLLIPMAVQCLVGRNGFNSLLYLIIGGLYKKYWVRKNLIIHLSLFIDKYSLCDLIGFDYRVKYVSFVQAIRKIKSPFEESFKMLIRQSRNDFLRVKLLDPFALFLLFHLLMGLSLFLDFLSF